jgi:membrane protease YdiL (CAAX protease family)
MMRIHSKTSKWLLFPGIIVMALIAALNWNDVWGPFALYECLFGIVGYSIVQWRLQQSFNPSRIPLQILPQEDRTMHVAIQFLVIMGMQFATGMLSPKYTPTIFEQAAYRVFAGPMEEMLFRAGIIILIIGKHKTPKRITIALVVDTVISLSYALLIESVLFAAIHTQYYGDFIAMLTVGLAGMIWGIFFVIWWDLGANMVSHFLVNAAAFVQWYFVTLATISPTIWHFIPLAVNVVVIYLVFK